LLVGFLFLQGLFQVMPFWRPVLWAQVLILVVLSFLWIAFAAGKRAAFFFLPVFIYLIIATPWPSTFEARMVRDLTMAVAAVTERIGVFATFHVPVYHPVAAAKQIATVDHVSGGRFGLNIVAGWNSDEFAMFGVEQRAHDDRYAVADEWVRFLQQIFAADEEFDFEGEFFRGRNVLSEPKPVQWPSPVVMNAGGSPSGRGFAAKHADVSFALLPNAGAAAASVAAVRTLAAEQGRELSVYAAGHIVCAATDAEARAEHRRQVEVYGDMAAAANAIRLLIPNSQSADFDHESMQAAAVAGFFALPLVGSPETVVRQMQDLSEAGVDGIALSWLDYEHGIAQYADVLRPALEEAGLRSPG
jgi:alkanesulfonate monooxygenase SsuD/methylene tetrahydromethanopterin reductase-like flavin-dependent oxidoreductase (luciferase family)